MGKACWCAVAALMAIGVPRLAAADLVPSPPEECPAGSTGQTGHCGPYCSLATCIGPDVCNEGHTCEEVELCVHTVDCSNRRSRSVYQQSRVEGSCKGGAACAKGTCQTVKACVPVPEEGLFSCAAAGSGGGLVMALLAGVVLVRRRRA